jgi:hypothetical protein
MTKPVTTPKAPNPNVIDDSIFDKRIYADVKVTKKS